MSNFGERNGGFPSLKSGEVGFKCNFGEGSITFSDQSRRSGFSGEGIVPQSIAGALIVRQNFGPKGRESLTRKISIPLGGKVADITERLKQIATGEVPEDCKVLGEGRPLSDSRARFGGTRRGHKTRQF